MSLEHASVGGTIGAATLQRLRDAGVLDDTEVLVADALTRLTGDERDDVALVAALAVHATRRGHVALDLQAAVADGVAGDDDRVADVEMPPVDQLLASARTSPAVKVIDAAERTAGTGEVHDASATHHPPLVLDGGLIYLDRYWRHERRLARALVERARVRRDAVDTAVLERHLARLFAATDERDDAQLAACRAVVRHALTIVTGGPGTGKTSTIVRMLATLQLMFAPPLRVVLAAPTGKAAARMGEAVRDALEGLDLDDATAAAMRATPAMTLHRLLGYDPSRPTRFRHDAAHPLNVDVVIVDEASMVSLPLMTRLVEALDDAARLVLVGDRDQLASVDAGAVLSDVCAPQRQGVGGVGERVVELTRPHRFAATSSVARLAHACSIGSMREVRAVFDAGADDVALVDAAGVGAEALTGLRERITAPLAAARQRAVDGADPREVLAAVEQLRVLAAVRGGPDGVEALNRRIEAWMAEASPSQGADGADLDLLRQGRFTLGTPVMVTRNDYQTRLFNGDVGVVVRDAQRADGTRVAFATTDGGVRTFAPQRVSGLVSVFAMSVHKSQGSQFDEVVLVLPSQHSPVLTRELLYTGVTRARSRLTLVADPKILDVALTRRVQRASGLAARLRD